MLTNNVVLTIIDHCETLTSLDVCYHSTKLIFKQPICMNHYVVFIVKFKKKIQK